MNGLVGCTEEFLKAEFARAAAKAAGVGQAEQFETGVVYQLQSVVAVEGEQRGMHDFENAREQAVASRERTLCFWSRSASALTSAASSPTASGARAPRARNE